jgi:hypothetical protein
VKLEVSTVIHRPVSIVWDFFAINHVQNHPRWDPTVELEATGGEPIGVGSVIKRRTTRFGTKTEGTMEIIEFDPERLMRSETHDGSMTIKGWAAFDQVGVHDTKLTLAAEFVGMDDSMADQIRPLMQRSAENIKKLIESET